MNKDQTREDLIKKLQRVAKDLGKTRVSRREFCRESSVSQRQILRYFKTWNELVLAAGLEQVDKSRIDDESLMEAMYQALLDEETVPPFHVFDQQCEYDASVYRRRWGTWDQILSVFREWVSAHNPDFQLLHELPTLNEAESSVAKNDAPTENKTIHSWERSGSRVYGTVLNFRGLQHAPVNEQGVVFLFGMVALELGFIVESVATGFPDCEAKRRVNKAKDLWERVSIEFEFQSRNFRDHGHDSSQCDLIVCWEHNWPECPIEVLELRSILSTLDH